MSQAVLDKVKPYRLPETENSSSFVPVEPFDIIVFGATGDLSRRKLIPSLFHRYCDGQVPEESRIIGVSRTDINRDGFRNLAKTSYHEFAGLNKDKELSLIHI